MLKSLCLSAVALALPLAAAHAQSVSPAFDAPASFSVIRQFVFKPKNLNKLLVEVARYSAREDHLKTCTLHLGYEDQGQTLLGAITCEPLWPVAYHQLAPSQSFQPGFDHKPPPGFTTQPTEYALTGNLWLGPPSRMVVALQKAYAPLVAKAAPGSSCALMWMTEQDPFDRVIGREADAPWSKAIPIATTYRVECLPPGQPGAKTSHPPVVSHHVPAGHDHVARATL